MPELIKKLLYKPNNKTITHFYINTYFYTKRIKYKFIVPVFVFDKKNIPWNNGVVCQARTIHYFLL
jgi:hypothetical protein